MGGAHWEDFLGEVWLEEATQGGAKGSLTLTSGRERPGYPPFLPHFPPHPVQRVAGCRVARNSSL